MRVFRTSFAVVCIFAWGSSYSAGHAVSLLISGSGPGALSFPGYGTATDQNNVISASGATTPGDFGGIPALFGTTGSGIVDQHNGATFISGANAQLIVSGAGPAGYAIEWTYVGSESGFANTFHARGLEAAAAVPSTPGQSAPTVSGNMLSFTENDLNDSPAAGVRGRQFLGTTTGVADGVIDFGFTTSAGGSVANGSNNDPATPGAPSLIFSYLTPQQLADDLLQQIFYLTGSDTPTALILIALNDSGSIDGDYDDALIVARVFERVDRLEDVPIPGTLPLFAAGAGIVALAAYRSRRRRLG